MSDMEVKGTEENGLDEMPEDGDVDMVEEELSIAFLNELQVILLIRVAPAYFQRAIQCVQIQLGVV